MTDVEELSTDTIGVTPQGRDWTEGYTEQWEYYEQPSCPECGDYAQWAEGPADDWLAWRCMDAECEGYGKELDPAEGGAEGPMMSYAYPLPDDFGGYDEAAAAKLEGLPLCIVRWEDGRYELALTGGGMDLSWEICEGFMRLGHLPPLHFCDLPMMAGLTPLDERHRWILAGCLRTCEVAEHRAARAAQRLRDAYMA
jgi:hypothetical protein